MTAVRLVTAAPAIVPLATATVLAWLYARETRQNRRQAARAAERRARPHSAHTATAQQDAAAITLAAVRAQCEDWTNPTLGGSRDARIRDQSIATAAGILLDLINHHQRQEQHP